MSTSSNSKRTNKHGKLLSRVKKFSHYGSIRWFEGGAGNAAEDYVIRGYLDNLQDVSPIHTLTSGVNQQVKHAIDYYGDLECLLLSFANALFKRGENFYLSSSSNLLYLIESPSSLEDILAAFQDMDNLQEGDIFFGPKIGPVRGLKLRLVVP